MNNLGKWALIDIETTGIDPNYDSIIDIGFLQFEGTKLTRKYSSLVRQDTLIPKFITKLTGINPSMLKNAPDWRKVETELLELKDFVMIAHNAKFEQNFLDRYFDKISGEHYFYDSILYLALLCPHKSTLNLESFLVELGIKDKEDHRGLSDSIDLLKVMLLLTAKVQQMPEYHFFLNEKINEFSHNDFWFKSFLALSYAELCEISEQIDFDLELMLQKNQSDDSQKKIVLGEQVQMDLSFNASNIKDIFYDELRLKKIFPSYLKRDAQVEMACRVGQSLKNNIHSIIQAPTGTGKTLGYLIPSALKAYESNEPVLISTGTKALQNQAVEKDIPELYKILNLSQDELKVVRLYGSSNHFCELKFRNSEQDDLLSHMTDFEHSYARAYLETIFFYNSKLAHHNNILTRESLPFVLKKVNKNFSTLEKEVTVDFRACTGHKCPFNADCTYYNGIKLAKDAHLIIGNHALMLSWPRSLDKPNYIIIDEAHKMESEVTSACTLVTSQADIEQFASSFPSMLGSLYYLLGQLEAEPDAQIKRLREDAQTFTQILNDHKDSLFENISKIFKQSTRYTDIYWNEVPMLKKESLNTALETALYNQLDSLCYVFKGIYDVLTPYANRWDNNTLGESENTQVAWATFESMFTLVENTFKVLSLMMEVDEKYAHSIRFHEEYGYELSIAPINIGEVIYESVLKDALSCVFTSATLANQDGTRGMASIEWMTGYQYLDPAKRFRQGIFLKNDFDYKDKVKVFICTNTPQIYDKSYVDHVLSDLIDLIKDIGGKTLLLFSSRQRFDKAIEFLLDKLESEIPLFVQGMGQRVVEDYKKANQGVLIGMESFSEGIDIPGDALKLVYIDKVPDLRRDLVIDQRRLFYQRNFGNEFNDYFLSHRTRSMHQKLGRLMRRQSDSGVIIVTDPRIKKWKKGTLDTFNEMMKPYELEYLELKDACLNARDFINS